MEWYLKVVRDNYANFEGRARRQEYWMFYLFNLIFIIVLAVISGMLVNLFDSTAFISIYVIYTLAVLVPTLAASVRRLHDIGKSGWYYLVTLIPFIGGIWLLILLATEGDARPNEYGPDPKRVSDLDNDIQSSKTHII